MAVVQMSAIPRFHATRKGAGVPMLTHDGRTVSWDELEARANRRARLFASHGVKVNDFVTIALPMGTNSMRPRSQFGNLVPRLIRCRRSCHAASSRRSLTS